MSIKRTFRVRQAATALALCTAVGCGGSTPAEPDTKVATIVVSPSTSTLVSLGQTAALSAVARTASGGAAVAGAFAWSVADGSIASIDQAGQLTALANGSTTVSAAAGGVTGSATVVVSQEAAQMEIVAGDVQYGEVALPLDSILQVRVLDAGSSPVAGVDVQFAASADGSVTDPTATTDAQGLASTAWTFGTVAGVQEVLVTTNPAGAAQATFTGTAAAGEPMSVALFDGDGQTELAEYALPLPISVKVLDAYGNGVPDVPVNFAVAAGVVADTAPATDLEGVAGTMWTLGVALGDYAATAAVDSVGTPVGFTATAVAFNLEAQPESSIVAGDTITLSGTGFDATPFGNRVLVDGVEAMILGGTQTSLSVVVPGYGCVPEKAVTVSLERDVNTDAESTVWRPAGALALAVGEQRILDSPSDFCLQFLADGVGNDEYLIGLTATSALDAEMAFTILADDGVTDPVLPAPARAQSPTASGFEGSAEGLLRSWEREHLPGARAMRSVAMAPPAPAPPAPGAALTVRVPDIGGDVCTDFTSIAATVRAVGARVAVATDDANPLTEALQPGDIAAMMALVDGPLFDVAAEFLGAPSDFDANERLLVLVTQEVNRLDAGLGFTTAADLFPQVDCASSDYGEVLYLAAPDPGGTIGTALSKADLLAEAPLRLAHDLAHSIQFGRRIGGGAPLLVSWLAEGQAQLLQEATGFSLLGDAAGTDYGSAELGGSVEAQRWYQPQFDALSRFYGWDGTTGRETGAPDRCSIFGFAGPSNACSGSFATGAAWSLIRYVTDRFGGATPGALHTALLDDGTLDARASLEAALGVSFDRLLVEWATTMYTDGRLGAGDAPDLQFDSWDLADVFGALPSERTLAPSAMGFSTFGLGRELVGGGTSYTLISEAGPRGPLAVRVRNTSDEALSSAMGPRLWVVRMR